MRKRSKEKEREYNLRSYEKHKEKHLLKNREWCKKNRERRRETQRLSARKRNRAFKECALKYYGDGKLKCVLCGESRIDALSIDHIYGGGNKERKKTGMIGPRFYKWLIDNEFPDGFRTLCMNCQFCERAKMYEQRLL